MNPSPPTATVHDDGLWTNHVVRPASGRAPTIRSEGVAGQCRSVSRVEPLIGVIRMSRPGVGRWHDVSALGSRLRPGPIGRTANVDYLGRDRPESAGQVQSAPGPTSIRSRAPGRQTLCRDGRPNRRVSANPPPRAHASPDVSRRFLHAIWRRIGFRCTILDGEANSHTHRAATPPRQPGGSRDVEKAHERPQGHIRMAHQVC